jgi:hypothetical protein
LHLKISCGAFNSDSVTGVANVKEDVMLFNTSKTSNKAVINPLKIFQYPCISWKTISNGNKMKIMMMMAIGKRNENTYYFYGPSQVYSKSVTGPYSVSREFSSYLHMYPILKSLREIFHMRFST